MPTIVTDLDKYFTVEGLDHAFVLFSIPHVVTLLLLGFFLLLIWLYRDHLRLPRANRTFRWSLAALLLLCEVALEVWQFSIGAWTLDRSLPLQLCSISLLLATVMLFTKSYALFEFLYLPGMAGALQAILTPDLGHYTYPHFRTFEFFIAHGAVVAAAFFMIAVERYRPTWRSLVRAFVALNLVALLIAGINKAIGANYMFLNAKPENASLLDLLGPWPWYILSLEAVALAMFLLLYAPFAVRDLLARKKVRDA